MSELCFQLKGSVVTTFILELYRYSLDEFTRQLTEKINQAPEFFTQSAVVINLDKIQESIESIDLEELLSVCRELGLQPMAFRCSDTRFIDAVKTTGLVLLSDTASRPAKLEPVEPVEPVKETVKPPVIENIHSQKSKIISRPVRSGQQIYAEGGDLIILSQVSEGAEVLADGNIHVYGSLRGRALAGVKGDIQARVFCTSLEAELVSIAGHFMLSDSLREKVWKVAAQVYLDDQSLHVEAV
jgi:septum site-determining protein MinC